MDMPNCNQVKITSGHLNIAIFGAKIGANDEVTRACARQGFNILQRSVDVLRICDLERGQIDPVAQIEFDLVSCPHS